MVSDLPDFANLLIFMFVSFVLSLLLASVPFFLAKRVVDVDKQKVYECGFDQIHIGPMAKFNVQFHLVAILFIIFDLEIAFVFPWAVALREIGFGGFFSMIAFLFILTIGFVYEWSKGVLDWR